MLRALRSFSLGSEQLALGDVISAELQESLPPGRVETLKAHRYVEEITDESYVESLVSELTKRVERLEQAIRPTRKRRAA